MLLLFYVQVTEHIFYQVHQEIIQQDNQLENPFHDHYTDHHISHYFSSLTNNNCLFARQLSLVLYSLVPVNPGYLFVNWIWRPPKN
jgi:hypothetical protein